jgi:hypothetical protein
MTEQTYRIRPQRTDHGPIPHDWTRLWYVRQPGGSGCGCKGCGREWVIGRTYTRGERFNKCARRWKCRALYQTPKGYIVALAAFPDNPNQHGRPYTTILTIHTGPLDGWVLETDADRNRREEDRCTFCGRTVMVRPWNRRARDKCPCGARRFTRLVRQGGKIVAEEEGWRKNGKEWIRC